MSEKHAAYVLTFENQPDVNGLIRLVNWVHGHGVLDRRAVANTRPDLCDPATFKMLCDWDVVGETVKYWEGRGATVKKVTEEEAEALRHRLETDPASFKVSSTPSETKKPTAPPTGARVRVHEIAKEFGLSTADAITKLNGAGLDVKAAASTVDADAARKALTPATGAGGPPHAS